MTTITLTTVWINPLDDPADVVRLPKVTQLTQDESVNARYTQGASGRIRQILSAGKPAGWKVTLPYASAELVAWLKLQKGRTLCLRNDRGDKVFGTFANLSLNQHFYDKGSGLEIALTAITYSEAV